jgi:hypothetical protein
MARLIGALLVVLIGSVPADAQLVVGLHRSKSGANHRAARFTRHHWRRLWQREEAHHTSCVRCTVDRCCSSRNNLLTILEALAAGSAWKSLMNSI